MVGFDALLQYRLSCQELSSREKELVIKSSVNCHRSNSEHTLDNKKSKRQRLKPSQKYFFQGKQICKLSFCFAHATSVSTLKRLTKAFDHEGLTPRLHANSNRLPSNALSLDDNLRIKKFIEEYAVENGLPLPGRMPNCPDSTVLLLPSDKSVADIHSLYQESAEKAGFRQVSLQTFRTRWKELCPHINVTKPATDLCFVCQVFLTKLNTSGRMSEEDKEGAAKQYSDHLELARKQRLVYKTQVLDTKATCASQDIVIGVR